MATRKWKNEFVVNTTSTGNQDQSSVTRLADGGFVVTWRDDGPADSLIRWQRYDATGVKLGSEVTITMGDGGDQSLPQVVQLGDGNLWFVNQDFDTSTDSDIDGWVYSLTGTFVRSQQPNISITQNLAPAIASLGGNGSVAVYYAPGSNGGDILARGFNTDGTERFAEVIATTALAGVQGNPAVAANRDGDVFAVTWYEADLNRIFARVFDSNGVPLSEFLVSSSANIFSSDSSVTWIDNRRFVVTWEGFDGPGFSAAIKYAIYNGDGTVFLSEQLANSTTSSEQVIPSIVSLPNGGFVIAWEDFSVTGADNSGYAIRLQAFDGGGQKTGGEILVNTLTAGDQFDVGLAALADGRVVVTWTGPGGTDASGTGIHSQIIDPRDGIIDGTGGVDTLYGNDVTDFISAGDGADTIYGLAGADTLNGGDGADFLYGGRGDDTIYGGAGSDNLLGELGDDEQFGEADSDLLHGSLGADLIDGGAGTDTLIYLASNAAVFVNLATNVNTGGFAQDDTILAIERISGSNFGDTMIGNASAQTLIGNGGSDTLNGGKGADALVGGALSDIFVFALGDTGQAAAAGDFISDYAKGAVGAGDRIDFASAALSIGGSAAAATATQASINAATGVATFLAGSGTTMADALLDITARMTASVNTSGEFAFFQVNATGNTWMFISDGVAGVTVNDTLVQLGGITSIGSIAITAGDVTILS